MKHGFTLIELLITMMIIALMSAIIIPTFDKYGEKSSFYLQLSEIQELMVQADNMMKNPEQNVSRYILKADTAGKSIELFKTDDSEPNLIKKIKLPAGYEITVLDTNSENYLVFDSPGFYCKSEKNSLTGKIPDCSTKYTGDFIKITNESLSSELTILTDPFRVNVVKK